jgi:hypothetical protein
LIRQQQQQQQQQEQDQEQQQQQQVSLTFPSVRAWLAVNAPFLCSADATLLARTLTTTTTPTSKMHKIKEKKMRMGRAVATRLACGTSLSIFCSSCLFMYYCLTRTLSQALRE